MDFLSVLLNQRTRKIGTIIPDVVISERHSDALEITEHPVERPTTDTDVTSGGAGFIADHAYRRPSELVMEVGFSGGGSLTDLVDTSSIGLSIGTSPKEIYAQLLALQRSREPLDVITGKRMYSNILIRSLDVTTDKTSENVLMITVTLREVILTQSLSITLAKKENMTEGVNTSAVQSTGVKTPVTANKSILATLAG
ncbi:hypothetical protein JK211_07885 [Tatumella sp. JGM130]|uniref:phage baseplate protein n=1 Tax=Tatumella sp. JGM130 TaxID=2799797 RepID=UPI001BAE7F03|nr:hypothetical protein [Tatumella sp. JGM130]MBS0893953.1 hypothetical protein [Tatumella sp. JGM130]